jgi:guanylate kinase
MSGSLFVIVAPSGAGKTSLVEALLREEPNIRLSVSYTTRTPRTGEVHGREYHFVNRAEFEAMLAKGEFLEHAEVYGNLYGTSTSWINAARAAGEDVLLEIDWQGAAQVHDFYPDMVNIFIMPPSIEALEQRLTARGKDAADVIARRIAGARLEMRHISETDFVIMNDSFASALADLRVVVQASRLSRARQLERYAGIISTMLQPPSAP